MVEEEKMKRAQHNKWLNRIQVSNQGGVIPLWRRDQKELFYLALRGNLNRWAFYAALRETTNSVLVAVGDRRLLRGTETVRLSPKAYDKDNRGYTLAA